MARPTKQGLDYFSIDVDFFENLKVRKIMRACGPSTGSILTCLLCNIYRQKGYYILWDEDMPFEIADKVGVSEGAVSEVVTKALQVDFFDDHLYQEHNILTSHEIQKRYRAGTAKRNDVIILPEFIVSGDKKPVNGVKNSINGAAGTQSKVKESIVNESKVKQGAKALVVASDDDKPSRQALKKDYEKLIQEMTGQEVRVVWVGLKEFIITHKPDFIEPFRDAWNVFAGSYKLSQVETISDSRKKKFSTRIGETGFDFLRVLEKIKTSQHLRGDNPRNWKVTFDWILENDQNYLKILEGNYD